MTKSIIEYPWLFLEFSDQDTIDFTLIMDYLKENKLSQETYNKYLELSGGKISSNFKDNAIWKEVFSKFNFPQKLLNRLVIPSEDEDLDFDWDLLVRLIAASQSSEYDFELDDANQIRLYLSVTKEEQTVVKCMDELNFIQIAMLYVIYIDEMINHLCFFEKEASKKLFDSLSNKRLQIFNKKIQALEDELEANYDFNYDED